MHINLRMEPFSASGTKASQVDCGIIPTVGGLGDRDCRGETASCSI